MQQAVGRGRQSELVSQWDLFMRIRGRDLLEYPVTVVGVLGLWSVKPGGILSGAKERKL